MQHKEAQLRTEYNALQAKLQEPAIYASKGYPQLARREAELAKIIELFDQQKSVNQQLAEARQLAKLSDAEMAALASLEIEQLEATLKQNESRLSELLLPKDPNDERDCIVEIRAAAGGDEASLFAVGSWRL
jgi:peptide chain release factor 1